jgi:chaperone required for assembly of F1-ATPase
VICKGVARFYQAVAVTEEAGGHCVRLDGRPVKTPQQASLLLPQAALAQGIAQEWQAQPGRLDPSTMPLTRLAFAAIDTVAAHRGRIRDEILAYGKSDLLSYRAEAPERLVAREAAAWDPLLDWAAARFGVRLAVGAGIGFVAQPPHATGAFASALDACDDFALTGLHGAAALTGSLVLALALLDDRLVAAQAFALSRLDEIFQAEAWGLDAQAEARAAHHARELEAITRFLRLAARP